jgi:hypothetical protein
MLCFSCQKIFEQAPFGGAKAPDFAERLKHSRYTKTVLDWERNGCQICSMLCLHFNADLYNEPLPEMDLEYPIGNPDHYSSITEGMRDIIVRFSYQRRMARRNWPDDGYKILRIQEENGL